jgi:hypothetical protein
MMIPFRQVFVPKLWYENLDTTSGNYVADKPQRVMREFTGNEEIPMLDLRPLLQRAVRSGVQVHFKKDARWTIDGHRIAAEALSLFLKSSGYLN